MNSTIAQSASGKVSRGLLERLKLVKDTLEGGNFIDRTHTLEDIKDWIDYPETYPRKYRHKSLYLLKTFTHRDGFPRVTALVWTVDQIIPIPCDVY